MSDLRDRIAAAIVQHHTHCDGTTWTQCQCDAGWRRDDEWAVHVADAVIAELGLRRADRPNDYDYRRYPAGDRYITDWLADEE